AGTGVATEKCLNLPRVDAATLVDANPNMTRLWERFPALGALNNHSFRDSRVQVINEDAMIWLEEPGQPFDVAIVDFPDPNSYALGKLYTTRFYRLLKQHLAPGAAISVQSTSPLFARNSYWCILKTIEAAGFAVKPYQTAVPSFGVWGFALAMVQPFEQPAHAPAWLRFLYDKGMALLFLMPPDLAPFPVNNNRLDNQVLVRYYDSEWKRWD